jgi:quinolinate synthase
MGERNRQAIENEPMIPTAYLSTPDSYRAMPDDELVVRVNRRKRDLGARAIILAHHYQRRAVVALGDYQGDSYALCKLGAQSAAEYIIFCGVHFMAESAVILSRPEQKVFLPNPLAGCPMADMAPIDSVLGAWDELKQLLPSTATVPIAYMNSAADLKAFCGANNGLICTSSNADKAFAWGFERGEKLFFFPDEHLGRNTANKLGIARDQIYVWNSNERAQNRDSEAVKRARVIVWKGYCHVHSVFRAEHVRQMRDLHPGIKIVVHPECTEDVVALADSVGSTNHIVNYVSQQPAGSTIAIGTELNLIDRLAHQYTDRKILELAGQTCAMCVNMYRTTLADLAYTLDNVDTLKPMSVPAEIAANARVALERMLAVGG